MSAADRENETPVETLERVFKERYQLTPLMPIEGVFPMCLAGDDTGEAFMFAAKLIAIQKIHGAPPEDQREYAMNFIGLSRKYGKEKDIQPISNPEEYCDGLIQTAHNMLVGIERVFADVDREEFIRQALESGLIPESMVGIFFRRVDELVVYCRENGIQPFDYEITDNESIEPERKIPFADGLKLFYERLSMGHSPREAANEAARNGVDVTDEMYLMLWEASRRLRGQEGQAFTQIRKSAPTPEIRKAAENAYNAATKALKRCRKHPAHQLLESFRAKDKLHGRFGCLQVPLAFLAFIVMVITPLTWWMSAILAFLLLVVMVVLRIIAGKLIVSGTVSAFKKRFPEGTDDYVDAYRLFSAAKDWEEHEGSDIPLVLEQLTPVDTSTASPDDPQAPAFHGFFYTSDPETGSLVKLPMSALQKNAFQTVVEDGFSPLDEETYWKQHYRYVITHTPQGYIAWEGKSYWFYVSFSTKECQHENCVHVIEFTPDQFRHKRIDCSHQENFEGSLENLASTAWLWLLDGVGRSRQRPLTQAETSLLQGNIAWTDEVHARMDNKFPLFNKDETEDE